MVIVPVQHADTDAPRDFRVISEDRFYMALVGVPIEFDLEHARRERGDLVGELHVRTELFGARTFQSTLSAGTFNVSRPADRQARAKACAAAARTKPDEIDWTYLLEEFCIRVLEAERAGAAAVDLRDVPLPERDDHHDVDGIVLPKRQPSMWYADGGVGKSIAALYYLGRLAQRGERVGFFDYELDAADHKVRYNALFGTAGGPSITYVRCTRPLVYEAERLKRIVVDERLTYAVLDSVAFACGGKPEDAEQASNVFRVERQLGIGTLNLAHVPKSAETGSERPFGSQFWYNGVRSLWFGASQNTTPDGGRLVIGFFHRKNNLGPLRSAVGVQLDFDADRIRVSRCNLAHVQELAERLPLWQRMKTALSAGPQTLARLAEELGAEVDTLSRTVRRKNGLFTRVEGKDGVSRIALLERRAS